MPMTDVPETIRCAVCGHTAERLPSSGEPVGDLVLHFFACDRCHEGGHIAVGDDRARREGPVFEAARWTNTKLNPRALAENQTRGEA